MNWLRMIDNYFSLKEKNDETNYGALTDFKNLINSKSTKNFFLDNFEKELQPLFEKNDKDFIYWDIKIEDKTVKIYEKDTKVFEKEIDEDTGYWTGQKEYLFEHRCGFVIGRELEKLKENRDFFLKFDINLDRNIHSYNNFDEIISHISSSITPKFIILKIRECDMFKYYKGDNQELLQYFYKNNNDYYFCFYRITPLGFQDVLKHDILPFYYFRKILYEKQNNNKKNLEIFNVWKNNKSFIMRSLNNYRNREYSIKNLESVKSLLTFEVFKSILRENFTSTETNFLASAFELLKESKNYKHVILKYARSLKCPTEKRNFLTASNYICFCPKENQEHMCAEHKNIVLTLDIYCEFLRKELFHDSEDTACLTNSLEEIEKLISFIFEKHYDDLIKENEYMLLRLIILKCENSLKWIFIKLLIKASDILRFYNLEKEGKKEKFLKNFSLTKKLSLSNNERQERSVFF